MRRRVRVASRFIFYFTMRVKEGGWRLHSGSMQGDPEEIALQIRLDENVRGWVRTRNDPAVVDEERARQASPVPGYSRQARGR